MLKNLQAIGTGIAFAISSLFIPTPAQAQWYKELQERELKQAEELGMVIRNICSSELETQVIGKDREGRPIEAYEFNCWEIYNSIYNYLVGIREANLIDSSKYPIIRRSQSEVVSSLKAGTGGNFEACIGRFDDFIGQSAATKKCNQLFVMTVNLIQNQIRYADSEIFRRDMAITATSFGVAAFLLCDMLCGGEDDLDEANRKLEQQVKENWFRQQR